MAERKDYGGSSGTPSEMKYPRTSAQRQTEEQTRTKGYRQRQLPVTSGEELDDGWTVQKPHTSAIRYDRPAVPPRRSALLNDESNPKKTRLIKQRRHIDRSTLIIIVSLIIIVMVGGWWIFSLLANWWTNTADDLHYGNPRTYQTDQFVGQGDSPTIPDHFMAVNINGRVVVVQLNLKHPELDHTYGITTTDPKNPVSLSFRPTGNTWAMCVIIEATTPYTVELVSNGKQFVSPN